MSQHSRTFQEIIQETRLMVRPKRGFGEKVFLIKKDERLKEVSTFRQAMIHPELVAICGAILVFAYFLSSGEIIKGRCANSQGEKR